MYSVVLAAMLTTGATAPEWGHRHYSCYGCHGNAFSCSGCYGCYGCYGCAGCYGSYSCYGCYGWSGCYGCYGCHGCYGAPYVVTYGCHGCHGCHGGYKVPPPPPSKKEKIPPPKKAAAGESADAGAIDAIKSRVTVRLPEDARLWVNSVACPLTSETRTFDTPSLEAGRRYYYTITAEVRRDGRVRSESREIIFEAGKPVTVDFNNLTTVATAQN